MILWLGNIQKVLFSAVGIHSDDFADYLLTDEIPKQKYVENIPANAQKWMDGFMKNNPKNPPLFYKLNKEMYK